MKYTRIYFFGGEKGRGGADDFVTKYRAENGMVIDVMFAFGNNSVRWYKVDGGLSFDRLKGAKAYCEKTRGETT